MNVLLSLLLQLLSWAAWLWWTTFSIFMLILIPLLSLYMFTPAGTKLERKLWFFTGGYMISGICGLMSPLFLFRPKHWFNALMATLACNKLSYLLGLTFEVRGANIAAQDQGAVICCNHQSAIDMFTETNFWPIFKRKTAIAKKEIFYAFPFGPAAYLAGVSFIDRKNARASYETLLRMRKIMVENRTKVLFYPEGTRNSDYGLLPFKKGAFLTAIHSQVPIIPMVIAPYYYDDPKAGVLLHEKKHNIISILDPIPTKGLTEADADVLRDKVYNTMFAEYEKLAEEVAIKSKDRGWLNKSRPRMTIINRKIKKT